MMYPFNAAFSFFATLIVSQSLALPLSLAITSKVRQINPSSKPTVPDSYSSLSSQQPSVLYAEPLYLEEEAQLPAILLDMVRQAESQHRCYFYDTISPDLTPIALPYVNQE
jgi:hypothetical protein